MNCLKCGRETQEDQVFCPSCQEKMLACPVKPDTVVHLPRRTSPAEESAAQEEQWQSPVTNQLPQLQKLTRWLTAIIAVLSLLLCFTAGLLVHTLTEGRSEPAIGRNYTSAQTEKLP